MSAESKLSQGEVVANLDLPQRNQAKRTLLRIRAPEGWQVNAAQAGSSALNVDDKGTVDISSLQGGATVHFRVKQR